MSLNISKIITEKMFLEKTKGIKKTRDKILFRLLWETGARITEILLIKTKNINLSNDTILINQLKRRTRSERIVPISNDLMSLIKSYIEQDKKQKELFDIGRKEAWVLSKNYFGKGFSPKQFRHSAAIDMINKGIPTESIRRQLGHSRIDITQNYLDYDFETMREHLKKRGSI